MSFAERLTKRRTQLGMSQSELARQTDIPQGLISRMEHGLVKEPGLTVLKNLALALRVSIDWLVGLYDGDDAPDPSWLYAVVSSP